MRKYDLIAYGRVSIDLYALEEGPKGATRSFAALVGGNPLNVAVGGSRLGLRTALVSAVGDDPVGEFVLERLRKEGVGLEFVFHKPGRRTPAVVLFREDGRFPLTFYREMAADWEISLADVERVPVEAGRAFFFSGTALAREPSRSAAFALAERARSAGATIYLDLDFRPDQWHDPGAYGVVLRSFLPLVHVVLGNEKEVRALRSRRVALVAHQASEPEVEGDFARALAEVLASGVEALVVKGGERGSGVWLKEGTSLWVEGFRVSQVVTPLGAGDAFAAGVVWARLRGFSWEEALRVGNACGAVVVGRLGCGEHSPHLEELLGFLRERGMGLERGGGPPGPGGTDP